MGKYEDLIGNETVVINIGDILDEQAALSANEQLNAFSFDLSVSIQDVLDADDAGTV